MPTIKNKPTSTKNKKTSSVPDNCVWDREDNSCSDTQQVELEEQLLHIEKQVRPETENAPMQTERSKPLAIGPYRRVRVKELANLQVTKIMMPLLVEQGIPEFTPWGHRDLQILLAHPFKREQDLGSDNLKHLQKQRIWH